MAKILYRRVRLSDIPAMAEIRAADWGTEEYWRERILQYVTGKRHPRQASRLRVSFVGVEQQRIVGLIAGHLTQRHTCEGELQWISVLSRYRKRGVASELLCLLAEWFIAHNVRRVCVDVEPSNEVARRFYARHGAEDLKPHWMVWGDIRKAVVRQRAVRPTP